MGGCANTATPTDRLGLKVPCATAALCEQQDHERTAWREDRTRLIADLDRERARADTAEGRAWRGGQKTARPSWRVARLRARITPLPSCGSGHPEGEGACGASQGQRCGGSEGHGFAVVIRPPYRDICPAGTSSDR